MIPKRLVARPAVECWSVIPPPRRTAQLGLHEMVIVDPTTLDRSEFGPITGVVYFDFGYEQYPEERWSDFVVIVLSWWLEQLLPLWDVPRGSARCVFMDGPYELVLKSAGPDEWRVTARGLDIPIRPTHVMGSLMGAAQEVLTECEARGWTSEEVERLAMNLAEAQWRVR